MNEIIGKELKNETKYMFLSNFIIVYMLLINNSGNTYMGLIMICLTLLLIPKPEYLLGLLFLTATLGEYFVTFKGIGMARTLTIVFIFGSLIYIFKNNLKISLKKIVGIIFLCSFCFISAATSLTKMLTPASTMSLNIVMLFLMSYTKITNWKSYIKNMMIGVILFSLYMALLVFTGAASSVSDRLTLGQGINANQLGIALEQLTIFLFGIFLIAKDKRIKLSCTLVMILNIVNLLLTGSRSATLACVCGMFLLIIVDMFRREKITSKLAVLLSVSILCFCIYLWLSNTNIPMLERFKIKEIIESGGTHRVDGWKLLINTVIPQHFWFGVGLGGKNTFTALLRLGGRHGTHNTYLAIIAETGLIGLLIFGSFFISSIRKICVGYLRWDYLIIPLGLIIGLLVNGIGEDIYTMRIFWFDLGLGYMMLNYLNKNKLEL